MQFHDPWRGLAPSGLSPYQIFPSDIFPLLGAFWLGTREKVGGVRIRTVVVLMVGFLVGCVNGARVSVLRDSGASAVEW